MSISCGKAGNQKQVDIALQLAATIFRSNEDGKTGFLRKNLYMSAGSNLTLDDVIVFSINGAVFGTCFLIDRLLYRSGGLIKTTFISSICLAESERGKGYSNILMDGAIEECRNRGSLLAVLIARRNVDHFYNRFGFWGMSQYSVLKLQTGNIRKTEVSKSDYEFTEAKICEIEDINNLYKSVYNKLYGAFERNHEYWSFIVWRCEVQGLNFRLLNIKGNVVGYIVYGDNAIHEIAAVNAKHYPLMLNYVAANTNNEDIEIYCSQSHPVVSQFPRLDTSFTTRECSYGGHMVRILDWEKNIYILESEILQPAEQIGLGNQRQDNEKPRVNLIVNKINDIKSQEKYSYENTAFLMRAKRNSSPIENIKSNTLESFNIPLMDQC